MRFAQLTLFVNSADCAFQSVESNNNADGNFARALRNGNDIDLLAGDGGKDAAGKARSTSHTFSYDRHQADVLVDFNRLEIAVRQFDRKIRLQGLERSVHIMLSNEKAEALTIAGTSKDQDFDISERESIESPGHEPGAAEDGVHGLHGDERNIGHGCHSAGALGLIEMTNNFGARLVGCETVLAPNRDLFFDQRRERSGMQYLRTVVGQFGGLRVC